MRVLLIVLMFFVFGALLIASNNGLALNSSENISLFSDLYLGWLDQLFSNVQTITGNVVGQDWFDSDVSK